MISGMKSDFEECRTIKHRDPGVRPTESRDPASGGALPAVACSAATVGGSLRQQQESRCLATKRRARNRRLPGVDPTNIRDL